MSKDLSLHFSLKKIIKMPLMSALILWIGIDCLTSDSAVVNTIGILNIGLGVLVLFVGLKSLLSKNPQVVLDENGIIDNRILENTIPWNEINRSELMIINNQKILRLEVSGNFNIENFKWLFQKTAWDQLRSNPKEIQINLDQLKIDYDSLNEFLSNKTEGFIQNNLEDELTGIGKYLSKILC